MKLKLCIFLAVLLCAFACRKPQPQLPANKNPHIDSTKIEMLAVNKKLIFYEDSLLARYASRQTEVFTKNSAGYWYRIISETKNGKPKENDKCHIEYTVYSLKNEEFYSKEEEVVIGKKQIIAGMEEMLKNMHRGETAEIILPWYLAYGLRGDGKKIEPYQSINILLKLRD